MKIEYPAYNPTNISLGSKLSILAKLVEAKELISSSGAEIPIDSYEEDVEDAIQEALKYINDYPTWTACINLIRSYIHYVSMYNGYEVVPY
jgi:hypothetical protein